MRPTSTGSLPLRVLSISTLFPSPARPQLGLFVARQFQALASRGGVEVTVVHPVAVAIPPFGRLLTNPALRGLPARSHDWGVDVYYRRFWYVPRTGPRWSPALLALAVLPLARRLHAERPFDLVDAQFFHPDGPAAASIARSLGLPLSIKARGSDIHVSGERAASRRAILSAAGQADSLLAVSEAMKRDMVSLGMHEDKIEVHYTGLDHGLFRPLDRRQARAAIAALVPVDRPLLAAIGNLIPLKGHDLTITALGHLPDVRLAIAGAGPEDRRLRDLAAQLGVLDRVSFLGSLPPERLALLLAASDVMVLPSENEGLANAWVEALACGTPLVITGVGGAREVVSEASAGRIVARSATAIAAAVRDLLADPPHQGAVAANAARFSWETNAAQLAAHYARLTGSQPR